MIRTFKNQATKDLYDGEDSAVARKLLPKNLHRKAQTVLVILDRAKSLQIFKGKSWSLEKLYANRKGQWSVRVTQKYRMCFFWEEGDAFEVEIVDYH